MLGSILRKIFGSHNDRELKRLAPLVEAVAASEAIVSPMTDTQLREKTDQFRKQLTEGDPDDATLAARMMDILPVAFAVVREASRRTLGMRHFDVQIIGGIALHEGKIAEMKTGEGKTLAATLPVYLNALAGRGVHVITVNDYLAKRDSQWMGTVYTFLGLTVACIQHDMDSTDRRAAYRADITYGTNNEFGFDYLRDNMKFDRGELVQRDPYYAIVDEVDSILIDEARTPLIISGPGEASTSLYERANQIVPLLQLGTDYTIEEKTKTATLTEEGNAKVESAFGAGNLYDLANIGLLHHVLQALRAHALYRRDVDYVVNDGQVVIVDEFTGRLMPGRRWSDGLHQAIEAKEKVVIENENQTLATITFQNYFRLYKKLAGMTGTADTEATEFSKIYGLEVLAIPPNCPVIRTDYSDIIYRTEREKFAAIVDEIARLHETGQPSLVGTISIEKSEHLSLLLKRRGIPHTVLNAKHHEKEAQIIAQAGHLGAVTIATNMAGRGTDILLGGNPDFLFKQYVSAHPNADAPALDAARERLYKETAKEKADVIAVGGLFIIGTERHESRRIDNQLRGRSGRQGDPGASRFYLSLEDDLLRIFGSDRISALMGRLGMEEGEPIEHRMVTRAIENAQKRVEGSHFDTRKSLLEYDDVMNVQRSIIYNRRHALLYSNDVSEEIHEMIGEQITEMVTTCCPENTYAEAWDIPLLIRMTHGFFRLSLAEGDLSEMGREALKEEMTHRILAAYERKVSDIGETIFRQVERQILLQAIDRHWRDHLLSMDHLREGIGLRGYGQKEPLSEYKREGFTLFTYMVRQIREGTLERLFCLERAMEAPRGQAPTNVRYGPIADAGTRTHSPREEKKVGRNDPCPCGSGKKYKKCCGN